MKWILIIIIGGTHSHSVEFNGAAGCFKARNEIIKDHSRFDQSGFIKGPDTVICVEK